jgi:hypothetical protein
MVSRWGPNASLEFEIMWLRLSEGGRVAFFGGRRGHTMVIKLPVIGVSGDLDECGSEGMKFGREAFWRFAWLEDGRR